MFHLTKSTSPNIFVVILLQINYNNYSCVETLSLF
jgi:hypothetical protein